jgi:quercetin dioxygenase-like cupin family protein
MYTRVGGRNAKCGGRTPSHFAFLISPDALLGLPAPPPCPYFPPMSVTKLSWSAVREETLNPLLSRKVISADNTMIAQVFLRKGCVVPGHQHVNEQITYILEGGLRFWIGEHAMKPGSEYIDVLAGEVLLIPGNVPHRAEALEDTLDVDVFNPPRQDWLDGSDQYLRK